MILDQFRLDKKVAIVTGAGKGIGACTARSLAEVGASVVCVEIVDVAAAGVAHHHSAVHVVLVQARGVAAVGRESDGELLAVALVHGGCVCRSGRIVT